MSSGEGEKKTGAASVYQITVAGQLDACWQDWFGSGFTVNAENGNTILTGEILDQSSLHGVIRKIRNLGVPLISVFRIDNEGEIS